MHEIPVKGTAALLQFAVEQHEYAMPLPLTIVLAGHAADVAHDNAVLCNTPREYVEADYT